MFEFTFNQQILDPKTGLTLLYITSKIIANTHLEAFTTWCEIPRIQDLAMREVGHLNIRVSPVSQH